MKTIFVSKTNSRVWPFHLLVRNCNSENSYGARTKYMQCTTWKCKKRTKHMKYTTWKYKKGPNIWNTPPENVKKGPNIRNTLPENVKKGPNIWNTLPENVKKKISFSSFKEYMESSPGPTCKLKICLRI